MVAYLLLYYCSDMGVGGVRRQGEEGPAAIRPALAAGKAASMSGSQESTLGLPASTVVSG